jgi:hypothetical protein
MHTFSHLTQIMFYTTANFVVNIGVSNPSFLAVILSPKHTNLSIRFSLIPILIVQQYCPNASHHKFLKFPSKQKGSGSLLPDPVHIEALNSFIFTSNPYEFFSGNYLLIRLLTSIVMNSGK